MFGNIDLSGGGGRNKVGFGIDPRKARRHKLDVLNQISTCKMESETFHYRSI